MGEELIYYHHHHHHHHTEEVYLEIMLETRTGQVFASNLGRQTAAMTDDFVFVFSFSRQIPKLYFWVTTHVPAVLSAG
jgi:hypothetical protein